MVRIKRKGNPCVLLVGKQTGAATVENSMEFPQKIKHGSALWSSNSSSGNISRETGDTDLKGYKHPHVHCSITDNSQNQEPA